MPLNLNKTSIYNKKPNPNWLNLNSSKLQNCPCCSPHQVRRLIQDLTCHLTYAGLPVRNSMQMSIFITYQAPDLKPDLAPDIHCVGEFWASILWHIRSNVRGLTLHLTFSACKSFINFSNSSQRSKCTLVWKIRIY